MNRIFKGRMAGRFVRMLGATSVITVAAMAQYGAGGTTGNAAMAGTTTFNNNYHIGFDRPEAWGLKYFASTSLLSGLMPPEPGEEHRVGSLAVGLELGWLPALDAGQRKIGFNGTAQEDLNKAPIFARPVVRVGLPWKLTAIVAAPPPIEIFGVRTHLLALGLERPIWEHEQWTLSWRGYGQFGSVKGAFTCPQSVLAFGPGTPDNPGGCVGKSADVASLRYAGSELEFAYRIPGMPKLVPHAAAGGNFIDGAFQVDAPIAQGLDRTRLWTRGGTFSGTAGVSYRLAKGLGLTVDAFYSPLWVKRSPDMPRTNDGLFNVRALISYNFR